MEGMVTSPDFWRGKRVFITGHTGFKGSWLCLWLQSMGAEVTGYALSPPTHPSLYEAASVVQGMHSHLGDIREGDELARVLVESRPDVVFHLAAQPLVRHSYTHPVETYATNVMGTVNLLEAVRQAPSVRSVIIVTSDKCYENREWPWGYREIDPMGGYDPYSNSKGCAELVVSAYRSSYFNPGHYQEHRVALASARAGNVIGGGDWADDRLVPDIIRAVRAGQPVRIRNPHAIRPWQHVLEPLSGYLLLAQRLYEQGTPFAQGWNFGPADDDAQPVSWIVDHVTSLWKDGARWELEGGEHAHEANYLRLDCSKARAELQWHPKWRLDQALEKTVEWYRADVAGADMRQITLGQIEAYL